MKNILRVTIMSMLSLLLIPLSAHADSTNTVSAPMPDTSFSISSPSSSFCWYDEKTLEMTCTVSINISDITWVPRPDTEAKVSTVPAPKDYHAKKW